MRGYQKKVVFLKNTGSSLFEEAYFVIRGDVLTENPSTEDMVDEASRIIEENFEKKKRISKKTLGLYVLIFLLGAFISSIAAILFMR